MTGFGLPARSLSLRHAPRPPGRRSKAANERNRGRWGHAYQQALWEFGLRGRRSDGAARRTPGLIVEGRHGVGWGVIFSG